MKSILERLHINKNTKVNQDLNINLPKYMEEGLPPINSRVLVVTQGKKTSRDSYVTYDVMEILDYNFTENTVILRKPNTNEELGIKYRIYTAEADNKRQTHSTSDYFFAINNRPGFGWSLIYNNEYGNNLISYGLKILWRKLRYVFKGYKLDCKGDKEVYLKKIRNLLNEKN